jgi:ABC-2 type transport system permease protein
MKRYFSVILLLCKTLSRRFVRDPVALFFTFLFPMLFLLVFGSLFRSNDVSFKVAFFNHADSAFAAEFAKQITGSKVFNVKQDSTNLTTAKEQMGRGEIDSIIELPTTFGNADAQGVPNGKVVVYYEAANPQTGQAVGGVMQEIIDGSNKKITPVSYTI